jgi:hypothetical protein
MNDTLSWITLQLILILFYWIKYFILNNCYLNHFVRHCFIKQHRKCSFNSKVKYPNKPLLKSIKRHSNWTMKLSARLYPHTETIVLSVTKAFICWFTLSSSGGKLSNTIFLKLSAWSIDGESFTSSTKFNLLTLEYLTLAIAILITYSP